MSISVKKLEWVKSNLAERWTAQYAFGQFEITRYTHNYIWQRGICSERFDSLEAAQAAAQADYERRILSALETPSPNEGEAVTISPDEVTGLQRRLDLHEAFVSFVHRWAVEKDGNGTSAEERLSAIANHPAISTRTALTPKTNGEGETG